AVAAVLAEKRQNGGYLEFRAAQKTSFGIFAMALAAQALLTWLLVNVIDTHFRSLLLPAVVENMVNAYRHFGATDDQVTRAIAIEKDSNPFSAGRMLQGLAYNYIVHFLIAVVIAVVLKRK